MYYNRYVWTHEADALGFRNRGPIVPADVLLLGDSFIYGHGVEYESAFLRRAGATPASPPRDIASASRAAH